MYTYIGEQQLPEGEQQRRPRGGQQLRSEGEQQLPRGRKHYIGLAANSFKERYNNHNSSFNNIRYQHSTSLSNYIWQLKADKIKYELHWSMVGRASAYTPESKCCQLCNLEKTMILMNEGEDSLNQRNELMAKCRHRAKHLLSNV